MTTTMRTTPAKRVPTAAKRAPMDSLRKTALIAGVLYLITIIASIPALILYGSVLNNPDYIISATGADTGVLWGGFLEMITTLACIGTAVVLFPVSNGKTKPPRLASSPLVSSKPPSSSSAS